MRVTSQDAVKVEGLRRAMQLGEDSAPAAAELPSVAGAADLEGLFLAELRSRRERLARWMQLIQQEVERESASRRGAPRRSRQCRLRSTRSANPRSR